MNETQTTERALQPDVRGEKSPPKPKRRSKQQQGSSDGLLSKGGLAPKLAISTRTLDDWMRQGRVPFLKLGKTVRFRLADVLEKLGSYRVH